MLLLFILFVAISPVTSFFSPPKSEVARGVSTTNLGANFLSELFGGKEEKDPNIPTVVFEIPAKDAKIGALQFLIQIHMVSQGNLPEKGTWFPKQNEDGGLDLYYKDGSGMCTIVITEYAVKAERYGSKPSLQYLLQESVLLHTVLDELEKTAFDVEDIEEEKRLLQLKEKDGIEKARETLPARAEDS
mmetsp:Transcript_26770/g.39602  ORF Transcript_26770/g.39602 Transcript_26770/m.39602 type:complete len:188 (-) Transcript_26770:2569-3132(-)